MNRIALLVGLAGMTGLLACGDDKDDADGLSAAMEGTYVGSIVITDPFVTDLSYTVNVAAVDGDTVSISGADFDTFEVDLMGTTDAITSLADDNDNQLTWGDGALQFVHDYDDGNSVDFNGMMDGYEADADADADADTDTDADADADTDTDTDADTDADTDSTADAAAGDYSGVITGPLTDVDYTVTLAVVDANTVEVQPESNGDFTAFEVPLTWNGTDIEASNWSGGSFVLEGDSLNVTHTSQGLSFVGDHD